MCFVSFCERAHTINWANIWGYRCSTTTTHKTTTTLSPCITTYAIERFYCVVQNPYQPPHHTIWSWSDATTECNWRMMEKVCACCAFGKQNNNLAYCNVNSQTHMTVYSLAQSEQQQETTTALNRKNTYKQTVQHRITIIRETRVNYLRYLFQRECCYFSLEFVSMLRIKWMAARFVSRRRR